MALRLSIGMATLLVATAMAVTAPVQAQVKGNFDDADTNKDGHVSLQEFETYATQRLLAGTGRLARRFQQLSSEQQSARLEQRFNKLDRNHKGYLDKNDWAGQ